MQPADDRRGPAGALLARRRLLCAGRAGQVLLPGQRIKHGLNALPVRGPEVRLIRHTDPRQDSQGAAGAAVGNRRRPPALQGHPVHPRCAHHRRLLAVCARRRHHLVRGRRPRAGRQQLVGPCPGHGAAAGVPRSRRLDVNTAGAPVPSPRHQHPRAAAVHDSLQQRVQPGGHTGRRAAGAGSGVPRPPPASRRRGAAAVCDVHHHPGVHQPRAAAARCAGVCTDDDDAPVRVSAAVITAVWPLAHHQPVDWCGGRVQRALPPKGKEDWQLLPPQHHRPPAPHARQPSRHSNPAAGQADHSTSRDNPPPRSLSGRLAGSCGSRWWQQGRQRWVARRQPAWQRQQRPPVQCGWGSSRRRCWQGCRQGSGRQRRWCAGHQQLSRGAAAVSSGAGSDWHGDAPTRHRCQPGRARPAGSGRGDSCGGRQQPPGRPAERCPAGSPAAPQLAAGPAPQAAVAPGQRRTCWCWCCCSCGACCSSSAPRDVMIVGSCQRVVRLCAVWTLCGLLLLLAAQFCACGILKRSLAGIQASCLNHTYACARAPPVLMQLQLAPGCVAAASFVVPAVIPPAMPQHADLLKEQRAIWVCAGQTAT